MKDSRELEIIHKRYHKRERANYEKEAIFKVDRNFREDKSIDLCNSLR